MAAPMLRESESESEDSDDELVIIAGAVAVICCDQPQHKRSCWVRDWIGDRDILGAYGTLFHELEMEDPESFKQFNRMSADSFDQLLQRVSPWIQRQDTVMRKAIKPAERLAVTLRYLASGSAFCDLKFLFRIGESTIHEIVMDTCAALYAALKDEVLKVPSTEKEWRRIAREFELRWNMPNCIGAMDGKHVEIESPGGGSSHYNYLKFNSIILFGVMDARYRFIYIDVGANGRAGDAAVFRDSNLVAGIERNTLGIPGAVPLPGRVEPVPHFFVGDDAFPLKTYVMKPFPFRTVMNNLHDQEEEAERRKQRIYDYRISRARRISENVFGILTSRFRVFRKAMPFLPDKAATVTLACIVLHNWLTSRSDRVFFPPTLPDHEDEETQQLLSGDWRKDPHHLRDLDINVNASTLNAREIREELKEYFSNEGQVPWQEQIVFGQAHRP